MTAPQWTDEHVTGRLPETVELPGGVLTRTREADGPSFADAVSASYEHLQPWMPWIAPAAVDPKQQSERCRVAETMWDTGTDYMYALRERTDGPVIGTFGLHRRVGPRAIEIGYWVHVDHIRRGYARNAAAALTDVAFAHADVDRVEIHTDEANLASAAVPRTLGYLLDRVDTRTPEAPAETGRLQIWVTTQPISASSVRH